jgi:hypothetical protein
MMIKVRISIDLVSRLSVVKFHCYYMNYCKHVNSEHTDLVVFIYSCC